MFTLYEAEDVEKILRGAGIACETFYSEDEELEDDYVNLWNDIDWQIDLQVTRDEFLLLHAYEPDTGKGTMLPVRSAPAEIVEKVKAAIAKAEKGTAR